MNAGIASMDIASSTNDPMTSREREALAKLVRLREKVAKSAARERASELRAEYEAQLAAEYSFDDHETWAPAQGAATSMRSIPPRAHNPPAGRLSQLTWKQLLAAHAETLVAADFFSVDTVFFKRFYVLCFVHLASRRVLGAVCTAEPSSACTCGSELSSAVR